jgi:hypothetical protein
MPTLLYDVIEYNLHETKTNQGPKSGHSKCRQDKDMMDTLFHIVDGVTASPPWIEHLSRALAKGNVTTTT